MLAGLLNLRCERLRQHSWISDNVSNKPNLEPELALLGNYASMCVLLVVLLLI